LEFSKLYSKDNAQAINSAALGLGSQELSFFTHCGDQGYIRVFNPVTSAFPFMLFFIYFILF